MSDKKPTYKELEERLIAAGREIKALKKSQAALRESEEKFKLITMNTPDHILVQDTDLRYTWVLNPQLGLSENDMIGKTDFDILSKEDADNLTKIKKRVLETGNAEYLTVPVAFPNGEIGYFEGSYIAKRDPDGRIDGIIGYFRNVTERMKMEDAFRKSEEALKDSQAELNAMIENVPLVVLLIDQERRLRKANVAAVDFARFPADEIIGSRIGEALKCLHSLDDPGGCGSGPYCANCTLRRVVSDTFEKQTGYKAEEVNLSFGRGGIQEELTFLVSTALVHSSKEILNLVCIEDITERKKREEELHNLNRILKALSKSNQTMMHATDEKAYLEEVCRIVVEDCGHAMVWIGFAEKDEGKAVRPAAYAGFEEGYLERLNISWADTELGRGPTGTAIRTGEPVFCRNMLTDPNFKPWLDEAIKRGYNSAIALPLTLGNKAFGAITIYSRKPDTFSEDEMKLLAELAGDLSYGIISLRLRIANVRAAAEEKRIKQELISTQNYLNKLLNYANAPIIVWNCEFSITRFNHAFERLTDYKAEEVIGKNLSILFSEDTREASLIKIKNALEGEHWEVVEIPILTKDRRIRIVLWNSANIYGEDGKTFVATIAQGQDITERKQTEAELELVASFPKENPYPVMRIGSDGLLTFANAASRPFLKAWDCRPDEPMPQYIREYISLALSNDKNLEIELSIGKQIFLTTFAPFPQAGYVNIYALDITKRKLAENEAARARDELEERVQARTKQLRSLALELTQAEQRERKRLAGLLHDNLQQLLVGAKWGVQAAQKKARDKITRESLEHTTGLLDEAIKASKSLVVELSPPILHEAGLVAALKWLNRWMGEKHGLALDIKADVEIEPDPEGVCVLLFQSVRELLLNVIKHSQVKEASISISRKDDQILIMVSDQGAGFDPVKLKEEGFETGFGLFSIRERLDLLGGRITIDSTPGAGTSVSITVPLPRSMVYKKEALIESGLPVQQDGMKSSAALQGKKIRVLVADDHKIMREGLCGLLRSIPDIEVAGEAFDGENAVELAKELHPDIVIMDVNMPRLNGIEATRRIMSEAPGVKVIGLSMYEEEDRASAMLKAGAVDYVHKAGPSQALIASIRAHSRVS